MDNLYPDDTITRIMPKKLKEFRKNCGLTIEEVGAKLNKTKAAVSMWESGKALPDARTLLKLLKLYNIPDFSDFFDVNPPVKFESLTRNEQKIILLYRQSSPIVRKSIENLLKEINTAK